MVYRSSAGGQHGHAALHGAGHEGGQVGAHVPRHAARQAAAGPHHRLRGAQVGLN